MRTEKHSLNASLSDNLDYLRSIMDHGPDITIREFEFGRSDRRIAVVYMDGVSDRLTVNEFVLKTLAIDEAEETSCWR